MKLPFRLKKKEPYRWNALAQYNAERDRGITHTESWVLNMAVQQEEFNAEARREIEASGATILD